MKELIKFCRDLSNETSINTSKLFYLIKHHEGKGAFEFDESLIIVTVRPIAKKLSQKLSCEFENSKNFVDQIRELKPDNSRNVALSFYLPYFKKAVNENFPLSTQEFWDLLTMVKDLRLFRYIDYNKKSNIDHVVTIAQQLSEMTSNRARLEECPWLRDPDYQGLRLQLESFILINFSLTDEISDQSLIQRYLDWIKHHELLSNTLNWDALLSQLNKSFSKMPEKYVSDLLAKFFAASIYLRIESSTKIHSLIVPAWRLEAGKILCEYAQSDCKEIEILNVFIDSYLKEFSDKCGGALSAKLMASNFYEFLSAVHGIKGLETSALNFHTRIKDLTT